jgi:hypothetical protein
MIAEESVTAAESQHVAVESECDWVFSLFVLHAESVTMAARARMLSAFMICFCLF